MEDLKYAILAIDKFKKHGYSNVRLRNKKLPKIDSYKFILGDLTDQSFNNMEPDKVYHCDEEYFYKSYKNDLTFIINNNVYDRIYSTHLQMWKNI